MLDTINLIIPDERELPADYWLNDHGLRVLETLAALTTGVTDAWCDERVVEAVARTKGWGRANPTLQMLRRCGLVESFYAAPPQRRPQSRHAPKPGMVWRLSHEGRLEHFAQRGRLFA